MILRRSLLVAVLIAIILISLPLLTFGQLLPERIVPCKGTDCTVCDIATLAQNLINAAIFIAIFLSAILFAWAGWKYLTNAANPGQVTKAKEIFFNVMVGLIIILGAWLVIDTLMKTLVGQGGEFGPWNQICSSYNPGAGSSFAY